MKTSHALGWLGPLLVASAAWGEGPGPVVSIRASHPDRQVREVIRLFEGARVPHPAAALAAWKRATAEPGRLGKPLEAVIASFNPAMADEFRVVDGAEVLLWFDPGDGRVEWGASLPRDDGSFAALGTAFALSGGGAEPPVDGLSVDRLAGPGSTLLARGPGGVFLGGSVAGIRAARDRVGGAGAGAEGLSVTIEPGAFRGARSLVGRRLAETLGAIGGPVDARVEVREGSLLATIDLGRTGPADSAAVEPDWLDWVPAGRAAVGFALAIAPGAGTWGPIFEVADRVERVDPARAGLAPLRLRLGLLATAAGVRAEADLFPHLAGVSGWAGSGGGEFDAAFLAFHLDDEAAAIRLASRARPFGAADPVPAAGPGGARSLGRLDGRPLRLARSGRSVLVGWGEGAMEESMRAHATPGSSAGPALRRAWGGGRPALAGGAWPSRVPGLVPAGSPLARALADAPPLTWAGSRAGPARFSVGARWDDLGATLRRFLDLIPLDPPPDH